ncbi:MAG: biopolymer transporter ExbD [Balneola sp.]
MSLLVLQNEGLAQSIEEKLYECLDHYYEKKGIDIDSELNDLESYLIQTEQIEGVSGKSYYNFYSKIVSNKGISTNINREKFKTLIDNHNFNYTNTDNCRSSISQFHVEQIAKSKFFVLQQKLNNIRNRSNLKLTPATVSSAIVEVLSPSDFETPFYRASALLTVLFISDLTIKIEVNSADPDQNKHGEDYTSYETFEIILKDDHNIYIGDKIIDLKDLPKTLEPFIRENLPEQNIVIEISQNASYRVFTNLLDTVSSVYRIIRNDESLGKFQTKFDELSSSQRDSVEILIPKNIIVRDF